MKCNGTDFKFPAIPTAVPSIDQDASSSPFLGTVFSSLFSIPRDQLHLPLVASRPPRCSSDRDCSAHTSCDPSGRCRIGRSVEVLFPFHLCSGEDDYSGPLK